METEPQIIFRGVDAPPDLTDLIHSKIEMLEKVHHRITSCRVTIEEVRSKGHKGHLYRVAVELEVPTGQVVVNRKPGDVNAHEDLKVALRDSFNAARRQLIGQIHKHDTIHVKDHAEKHQGTVLDVFPGEGFGFLETEGGEELYFQRDSVVAGDWNQIEIGSRLHYARMEGEKGPFAVNIALHD